MKKFFVFVCLFCLSILPGFAEDPIFEKLDDDETSVECTSPFCYVGSWSRYRINFGMEKVHIRFPNDPLVTQENGLLIGSTTHHHVLYKFIGYFPPVGSIDPYLFFKRELDFVSVAPFVILNQTVYQVSNGDWVMDYVVHDTYANMLIKHRSIVTPFNAYTLRAIFPYGYTDHFDYFCESFRIQCVCNE